jgi:CheY-like chemotaxis protein
VAKILVIDDSKLMRTYLRRCLENAGFEVEDWVPPSAIEVPEYLTASAPDLILTDYQMPGCNGATVARMAQRAVPRTPLVVLTAVRDLELHTNLRKLGVKDVLVKPIESEALVKVLKGVLAVPEMNA